MSKSYKVRATAEGQYKGRIYKPGEVFVLNEEDLKQGDADNAGELPSWVEEVEGKSLPKRAVVRRDAAPAARPAKKAASKKAPAKKAAPKKKSLVKKAADTLSELI